MELSESIRFKSERFDYSSELPPDFNAGNRFYGKDVAAHLSSSLTNQGLPATCLDEDWGWLVTSGRAAALDFEIAVYNLAEHRQGGMPGSSEWGLWVRSYERTKALGFIPRRTETRVSAELRAAVVAAIREIGAEPADWRE